MNTRCECGNLYCDGECREEPNYGVFGDREFPYKPPPICCGKTMWRFSKHLYCRICKKKYYK